MCLIILAGKNTDKYSEFLRKAIKTSAETNKDGFGFGFKRHSSAAVGYKKGFSTIESMLAYLDNLHLDSEDELVIHLRRISSGHASPRNAHPFVCNYEDDSLIDDIGHNTTKFPILFHNGHFGDFVDISQGHSDTFNFVDNFFKFPDIFNMLKNNKLAFLQVFRDVVKQNKLAVMYPNCKKETVLVGDFKSENGYFFSNETYKSPKIINNGHMTSVSNNFKNRALEDKVQSSIERRNKTRNKRISKNLYSDDFEKNLFNIETEYEIKLTEKNYDELDFIANCYIAKQGIQKGQKFTLSSYDILKDTLHDFNDVMTGELYWVSTEELKKCFDIVPNSDNEQKYRNIEFLYATILPTKSSIKKILTKYNKQVNNRKRGDYTISLKYGNSILKNIRLDAIKVFIDDNADLLNSPLDVSQFG